MSGGTAAARRCAGVASGRGGGGGARAGRRRHDHGGDGDQCRTRKRHEDSSDDVAIQRDSREVRWACTETPTDGAAGTHIARRRRVRWTAMAGSHRLRTGLARGSVQLLSCPASVRLARRLW